MKLTILLLVLSPVVRLVYSAPTLNNRQSIQSDSNGGPNNSGYSDGQSYANPLTPLQGGKSTQFIRTNT